MSRTEGGGEGGRRVDALSITSEISASSSLYHYRRKDPGRPRPQVSNSHVLGGNGCTDTYMYTLYTQQCIIIIIINLKLYIYIYIYILNVFNTINNN